MSNPVGGYILSVISIYIAQPPKSYAWVITSQQNLDDEPVNVDSEELIHKTEQYPSILWLQSKLTI